MITAHERAFVERWTGKPYEEELSDAVRELWELLRVGPPGVPVTPEEARATLDAWPEDS